MAESKSVTLRTELVSRRGQEKALTATLSHLEANAAALREQATVNERASLLLKHCGDAGRLLMKKRVEPILAAACKAVYPDLVCELEFVSRRGLIGADMTIATSSGVRGDPRNDTFGGGVCDLISTALRAAFCAAKSPSRILTLDEGLKCLGRLAPRGAMFLHKLASGMLEQVILVTHTEEFEEHADALFEAHETAPDTCTITPVRVPAAKDEHTANAEDIL